MNKVKRICLSCKTIGYDDEQFTYMGSGVWYCHNCCSKYTEVYEVIENAINDSNEQNGDVY